MSEWTEGAKVKSLEKIEKDLHSIDISLGRIANALEKLADGKGYDALSNQSIELQMDKKNNEEQHCPFQPAIICVDANDPDECNKCIYHPKEPTEVKNENEWPENV